MDHSFFEMLQIVFVAVMASSGFWAFIMRFSDRKSKQTKMLVGLAHDRIIWLGMAYLNKGEITHEEYENLHDYLYQPYADLGGNGSAKHIMDEVNKLKIAHSVHIFTEEKKSV